jgi:hypothetical protein
MPLRASAERLQKKPTRNRDATVRLRPDRPMSVDQIPPTLLWKKGGGFQTGEGDYAKGHEIP